METFLRRRHRIEWGECDPAGIVYAPRFLDMFSENTIRLFEAAGLPKKREMLETGEFGGFPMVDLSARFLRPAAYGDDVLVESAAPVFGNSSFTVDHRLTRDGETCVECTEKRVWTMRDPETGRLHAMRVPDHVRALFADGKGPITV
ncbi:MAG TPA: acyl-CoA thioesterase [Amphiplicatus sp.]|nr:acyl-CoA thioesterase [Amphiplicatus sp.]